VAWDWLKKRFGHRQNEPEPGPKTPPIPWIEAAENPWGVRVLDVRPVTLGMLSTTRDEKCARNAISYRGDDGASFFDQVPEATRRIPAGLKYRVENSTLVPGALFLPESMEDKWALFFADGRILCIRSWLRKVVAIAQTRIVGDFLEVETIDGALVSEEGEEAEFSVRALDFLLRSLALGLEYPAPLPIPGIEHNPSTAALMCMSIYGRAAHFATPYALGFEPPEKPIRTYSVLHIAVARGDAARVRELLDQKVPVDLLDRDGLPPLHWALARPDREMLNLLLECGSSVDVPSADGTTALMRATQQRKADWVGFVLDKGAVPNARDARGFTALHRAAEMGEKDIVRILLERGATPNVEAQGHTPRSLAQSRGETEIVKLLDAM